MILGGSRYILPVIEIAKKYGCETITCSNNPKEIGHKYSDKYYDVSVLDKEGLLNIAKTEKIDGIVSFACDPGVVAAAYVSEKMNLHFQGSYKSTCILQDKGLFREFLLNNNFNCPQAKSYSKYEDAEKDIYLFKWPVIVKPVDSAGSKGVTKISHPGELKDAVDVAIQQSISGSFIIEEFLTFKGYHSSTDVFTVDGKVVFISFSDQLFDKEADNPYTPALIIWPSTMEPVHQKYLVSEIQRLMNLLDMKTGIYNIESCVDVKGRPYIMEVSPRGGGCKIAELQHYAFGIDLIEAEVRNAIGMPLNDVRQTECNGCWCEMVIHAHKNQEGILKEVYINPEIKDNYVKMIELSKEKGEYVQPFTGANMALGDLFLKTEDRRKLDELLINANSWLKIELEKRD